MANTIARVAVLRSIRIPQGGHLDGVTLTAPAWATEGEHSTDAPLAAALEAEGYVEVLSVDGAQVVWQACCNGHHA